ncbi:MAG TPA: Gfo/Idh/MocA family oxidoreductase [Cyclobacteriaceae bacterium]|nr:Gfo/Idh/MocA family oxidoreductase [Cyclobacteriaceae bacterium]
MKERRSFLKKLTLGAAALNYAPSLLHANTINVLRGRDQTIRIGLIGKGGMGTSDTNTALRVGGTKLVAVCDLYDARLKLAKDTWGDGLFLTKEYKEVLHREDVDAVIVATPDHWHQQIAIEAMKAGKHVYCEKPVIHKLSEGKDLIQAQKDTGKLFQNGSQGMASLGNRAAKALIDAGAIGKINYVEAQFTAAPQELTKYIAPDDATPESIWWDRFLGKAPRHTFDPQRFFSWRNWKDYGTGLAGDLFVHVLSSIHFILDAVGPSKVYTTGGLRYYTNGYRDTPDIMLGLLDYPDRDGKGAFTVSIGANYADGVSKKWGSTDFTIVGEKGSLEVHWDNVILRTHSDANTKSFASLKTLGQGIDQPIKKSSTEYEFKAEEGYQGGHYDHLNAFIKGVKTQRPLIADVLFGVRTSSAALLSFDSYFRGEPIYWDAEHLTEIEKPTKA